MGPLPKRKHSKARRDRRRSQDQLTPMAIIPCSNCGAMHMSHTVCAACGMYHGRAVLEVDNAGKK